MRTPISPSSILIFSKAPWFVSCDVRNIAGNEPGRLPRLPANLLDQGPTRLLHIIYEAHTRSLHSERVREGGTNATCSPCNENGFFSEVCVNWRSGSVHVSE